tara:strand:+ start:230 stop:790 length:561 start_codon:yes stop_codon:yes gene_type:complete
MDPINIINKYYEKESLSYYILLEHSRLVEKKAVSIAKSLPQLALNIDFIKEASLLHDIGIFLTNAPGIGCNGDMPYICHGYLGAEILIQEGLPKHALVCERHTGTGITSKDITENDLPLPIRDMMPISVEEQIICYADNFFSKNKNKLHKERSIKKIQKNLLKFGEHKVAIFNEWHKRFSPVTNSL